MSARANRPRAGLAALLVLAAAASSQAGDFSDFIKTPVELWASSRGGAAMTGWLRAHPARMAAAPGTVPVALTVQTEEDGGERLCTQVFAFPTKAPAPAAVGPLEPPSRVSEHALHPAVRPFPNPSCAFRKVMVQGGCVGAACTYKVAVLLGPSAADTAVMHVPEQQARLSVTISAPQAQSRESR